MAEETKTKSGFEKSLEGEQNWPPKVSGKITINPEWRVVDFEIEFKEPTTVNTGPKPIKS